MEDVINTLDKRKEKIIKWIKNPYNFALVAILAFAIIIRIYYFNLTQGQVIWWDEAEYMNMARAWAFGLDYQFFSVRPILFSLITAGFFKISYGEFLPRMFIFLISIASIAGVYYLGKEIYDKKIGLLCAFFASFFYLHLFHTYRLLVDLPSFAFFTFAAFFFYKYFKDNKKTKSLYLGAAIIAIGTLFRITTATFLFAVFLYVLITEKLNFLKKKEIWIAALIFVLILSPYIIWGYIQFNGFVITLAGAWNAPQGEYLSNFIWNFKSNMSLFPSMFSWTLLIFFILGLFSMYGLILGFDVLIKGEDIQLKRNLFLFLIFLIPIITISFSMNHYFEDRYIINSLPAIFIISSAFIMKSYNFIKKKNKIIAIFFLILLLVIIAYSQISHADSLIKNKKDSYLQVKQAGLWLKQNSEASDIIIVGSWPQIMYYSERKTLFIPSGKEELISLISSDPNIKFYMVSVFERHENWMYSFPQENNFTIAQAYFADASRTQPILIIYEIQNETFNNNTSI